jgi:hypothetical protein
MGVATSNSFDAMPFDEAVLEASGLAARAVTELRHTVTIITSVPAGKIRSPIPKMSRTDIIAARRHAALLVDRFGDKFLPIFLRLEEEAEKLEQKESAMDRARRLARETAPRAAA